MFRRSSAGRRRNAAVFAFFSIALTACADRSAPSAPAANRSIPPSVLADQSSRRATVQLVRQLAVQRGIFPLPKPPKVRKPLVLLGQALAFDRILSGNRDISCMTCHLPAFATGDGKSLPVGQGGQGLGPNRSHPQGVFIARNAPPLFNLHAMLHLFWDGRVSVDVNGTLHTPAGAKLTSDMSRVFEFGPVSAAAMFAVTGRAEMRASAGNDNELATIADTDLPAIWTALMRRLGAIPEYRAMFENAYKGTRFDDMTFAHASNAIAGFLIDQFTFADSPWDRFLRGQDKALTSRQLEAAQTFLTLKCSVCHSGTTFSDEQFHDVAVAQIGPGERDGPSQHDDFARMRVTGSPADQYRFRTTPLRNVELTGPYGHDGAIQTLRGFVEHYGESDIKLQHYDPRQLEPLLQNTLVSNTNAILAQRDTLLNGVVLTDEIVDKLTDYMKALTDDAARDLSKATPKRVPSGLPVDRP